MKYYSTNHRSPRISFQEAVKTGLAPDGGLYLPEDFPVFTDSFFKEIAGLSYTELAFEVCKQFTGDDIPGERLKEIVTESFDFEVPLIPLDDRTNILELFHGPTLAFKDFGARFLARVLAFSVRQTGKKLHILVATSGDTGSAVAQGFFRVPGVHVVLLYPSKKVSPIQEIQLTCMGENISALEIQGTFDDCQKLVKEAFVDQELGKKMDMTSANSINIARLVAQVVYYFYAYANLSQKEKKPVISVPSGNFGNLTGGLFAEKMGLPVKKFIASTNINDVVPCYLLSGSFEPRPSLKTMANAMDVGNPSNFIRMLELFDNNREKMAEKIIGHGFSDAKISAALREAFLRYKYIMDPHTATGYLGLKACHCEPGFEESPGIVLSTAHPAKFLDIIEPILGKKIAVPQRLAGILQKKKKSLLLSKVFSEFKDFLLSLEN
ncbi:threonine synthase [Candidatus Riflebacteria bacterium]